MRVQKSIWLLLPTSKKAPVSKSSIVRPAIEIDPPLARYRWMNAPLLIPVPVLGSPGTRRVEMPRSVPVQRTSSPVAGTYRIPSIHSWVSFFVRSRSALKKRCVTV